MNRRYAAVFTQMALILGCAREDDGWTEETLGPIGTEPGEPGSSTGDVFLPESASLPDGEELTRGREGWGTEGELTADDFDEDSPITGEEDLLLVETHGITAFDPSGHEPSSRYAAAPCSDTAYLTELDREDEDLHTHTTDHLAPLHYPVAHTISMPYVIRGSQHEQGSEHTPSYVTCWRATTGEAPDHAEIPEEDDPKSWNDGDASNRDFPPMVTNYGGPPDPDPAPRDPPPEGSPSGEPQPSDGPHEGPPPSP